MTIEILYKDDVKGKIEVLKQSPSLADLGEDEISEIASTAIRRHFSKGEYILQEGDMINFFYVIEKGMVKVFIETPSGRNVNIAILGRSETILTLGLLAKDPLLLSARAIGEVTVLCVRREDFLSFFNKHPSMIIKVVHIVGDQYQALLTRFRDMVVCRAEKRVTNILLMLSFKFGTTLYFTAEDIADLAGTTRETTQRVISQLKNFGVICTGGGKVIILNETKLKFLSDSSYPYF
jgi:CRP-like cAMP-binding protein